MTNEEVLGALKSALERGESLSKATRTLRNARYKKEDIDEAAAVVSEMHIELAPQPIQKNNPLKFLQSKSSETPSVPSPQIPETPKPKKTLFQKLPQVDKQSQKVSNYDENKPKKKSKIIYVLIFLLFFVAIIMTSIFFFNDEIFSLISKFFP